MGFVIKPLCVLNKWIQWHILAALEHSLACSVMHQGMEFIQLSMKVEEKNRKKGEN